MPGVDMTPEVLRGWCPKIYWNHCWYCGVGLVRRNLTRYSGGYASGLLDTFTLDHVVAKRCGGKNKNNIVPCCLHCNRQKLALTVEEFRIVFFGIHCAGLLFWGEQISRTMATPEPLRMADVSCLEGTIGVEPYRSTTVHERG